MKNLDDKLWIKAVKTIQKAGGFPIPVNDTIIELTKTLMTEEEAKFLLNFRKPSLNINQLMDKTGLEKEVLENMLDRLMNNAVIIGTPSRSTGIMVYSVMPYLPGIFEFTMMRGESGEREKKLANLFEKLHDEMTEYTQNNYESFVGQYEKLPIMDRVVPVEEQIDVQAETVVHFEEIKKLIENVDDIAVSHCYCRHYKDLLDEHCETDAPKLNCFQLGKTAVFVAKHGFGKLVSKEEAMKILREAEDAGLVHKVIHVGIDPNNIEAGICNCCKDCCNTFQMYYRGIAPIKSLTSYIAKIDADDCIGCGTCVERCPVEAPELMNSHASIIEDRCIGCGVCAHLCPEEAINLERTGPRIVFIPPPRIKQA